MQYTYIGEDYCVCKREVTADLPHDSSGIRPVCMFWNNLYEEKGLVFSKYGRLLDKCIYKHAQTTTIAE